ncbi:hypothetical protein [Rhodobacter capsulatus]|uniref:YtxH domain-containing protein n=1 Tax=Rhodobacter capsulatus (strain ATCC BAA-309 / NBRC 16581 / SB1003) TaxID=272942 RepID=D5AQZ5_RHOCB|nr:hypothetical protein [Rhodobacter capsulatus]ADE84801.1 conserved hypothetical protein [Rhodobacter capsulatus SB 1003]ETD02262.1 hypothetical protein U714_06420 [Rhodobacter capsulatus DE442]ETD78345.1 hypothetical protein U717_06425 [Rhodobacter capsulatus R121]ETD81113.1 hypothetical protein U716_11445 [Rhodobacter capsulatus B6]ETD81623.1 hypothetical protein U703_14530 [Rhodobacter capsulatus YW1]
MTDTTSQTPATSGTDTGQTGLLSNPRFLTGAVVGGLVTYVLTNEAAQRKLMGGLAQLWLGLQGGLEEAKERFRDAESEVRSQQQK